MVRMTKRKTDFHENSLDGCRRCSAKVRDRNTTANGYCKVVNGSDGLAIKCVGGWGREKVFTVSQYLGIFADAMWRHYDHLNYFEVCSGPGRCATRDGDEIDGTAMAVLRHWATRKLSSAVFVDVDKQAVETLNERIRRVAPKIPAVACVGDYNNLATIDLAIRHLRLDGRTLTLCVLDPYDCSMPFELIRYIKDRVGSCDFIISYFDGLDAKRNLRKAIRDNNESMLSRFGAFLGLKDDAMREFVSSEEVRGAMGKASTADLMELFWRQYVSSLKKAGLPCIGDRPVRKDIDSGVEFYRLLFAAAHERALDFWNKIGSSTSTGQRLFSFLGSAS